MQREERFLTVEWKQLHIDYSTSNREDKGNNKKSNVTRMQRTNNAGQPKTSGKSQRFPFFSNGIVVVYVCTVYINTNSTDENKNRRQDRKEKQRKKIGKIKLKRMIVSFFILDVGRRRRRKQLRDIDKKGDSNLREITGSGACAPSVAGNGF